MKNFRVSLLAVALLMPVIKVAAFCGFYVAQAGSQIFNNKSEVILVRDGERQTITMLNDFKGDLKKFAMVIPVPVVLHRSDIRIIEQSLFASLDRYSAPRLVEYYDQSPCYREQGISLRGTRADGNGTFIDGQRVVNEAKKDKVKIEAQYSIDEYEIVILSAKESDGLENWLNANGYTVPENAKEVLEPYIKDKMKFFAVKVNLEKAKKLNNGYLRPIQIAFNTAKFMLPIRLGMANSSGEQDLVVYAFTHNGRVEAANYRTVEMPTAKKVPTFVKDQYGEFYKDMFSQEYEKQGKNAVFVEYAWNVSPNWGVKCDPCVGNPPIVQDLINAGVSWIDVNQPNLSTVFFTRLHVRYSREKFPEDLAFIETPNSETYQVRQIITHPAQGTFDCTAGKEYEQNLYVRRRLELEEMALLAGWNPKDYPNYTQEGSGEKIPEEQQDQQNEQKGNLIPMWIRGGGKPPGWMLPVLLMLSMFAVSIVKRVFNKMQHPVS